MRSALSVVSLGIGPRSVKSSSVRGVKKKENLIKSVAVQQGVSRGQYQCRRDPGLDPGPGRGIVRDRDL